jgi:uncharacterized RDD family membrane protein YckC
MIGDASKERLIAVFIDNLIAIFVMFFAVAMIPPEYPVVKAVLFFLAYLAYFVILEALWSRTLGKYFQGLIVLKLDGSRCDWKAAIIRSVLRVIEVNPLLLGGLPAGLVIISTSSKQRIGDLLAGTVVVSNKAKFKNNDDHP